MKKQFSIQSIIVLSVCLLVASCTESYYVGKINLIQKQGDNIVTVDTVTIRPLSEEPRIANMKNNLIQIVVASNNDQSCTVMPKFETKVQDPPIILLINFTGSLCGLMKRREVARQTNARGMLVITDDPNAATNHCGSLDDNSFFTGIIDSKNASVILKQGGDIYGSLSIELSNTKHKLIEIWVSSLNKASYDYLGWWNHTLKKTPALQDKIQWRPRFAIMDGCHNTENPQDCKDVAYVSSCACKGQFCSPEAHQKASHVLVREDIRQSLIFEQHPNSFFQYIHKFKNQCLERYMVDKYAEDCSSKIMGQLELDSYSMNAILDEFLATCDAVDSRADTEISASLMKDRNAFRNYGRYPLMLINKEIIEFNNRKEMQAQVCKKFSMEQEEGCVKVNQVRTVSETIVGLLFYLLVIGTLIAVGAFVVICYRNKLRKDVNKEMKMQVETAVQHYFTLSETTHQK